MFPSPSQRLSHSSYPERWIVPWAVIVSAIESKITFPKQGHDRHASQTFAKMSNQFLAVNP